MAGVAHWGVIKGRREIVRNLWQMAVVVLMGVSSLLGISTVYADDNNLLPVPCNAYGYDGSLKQQAALNWISNQSITAGPGDTVNMAAHFSIYSQAGPLERQQLFFIYSWTPAWPPAAVYYFPLYDGVPGTSPGTNQVMNVSFSAPNTPGIYYIWFCQGDTSNIATAVSMFSKPLLPPAAIKLTITLKNSVSFLVSDSPGAKLAYNAITAQAAKEGLAAIGTEYYNPKAQGIETAVSKLTSARPQNLWIICSAEDKAAIEKELRKAAYPGDVRYHEGTYIEFNLSDNSSELSAPLNRGATYKYYLTLTNTGWLPLDTVITDVRISKPGAIPLWSETKSVSALIPGASAGLEFVFLIPQKADTGEYVLNVQSTGYEGQGKSGAMHQETMATSITIASKSIGPNVIPVVVGIVVLGLIVAILISTRRRGARAPKRSMGQRRTTGGKKNHD